MVCLGHFHEVDFFLAWNTHAGNFCLAENWSRNMKKVKGLFLRNTGRRCVGFPLLLSPIILNSKNQSFFPWEENNRTLLVAGMLNYSNKLLFLRERRMKDEGVLKKAGLYHQCHQKYLSKLWFLSKKGRNPNYFPCFQWLDGFKGPSRKIS